MRRRREGSEHRKEVRGAKNLLQNNKLSPDDFCRRVFRGWLLPEVTSLFLTDDAIIQVLGDVQENGLPRPRLALCRAPVRHGTVSGFAIPSN